MQKRYKIKTIDNSGNIAVLDVMECNYKRYLNSMFRVKVQKVKNPAHSAIIWHFDKNELQKLIDVEIENGFIITEQIQKLQTSKV